MFLFEHAVKIIIKKFPKVLSYNNNTIFCCILPPLEVAYHYASFIFIIIITLGSCTYSLCIMDCTACCFYQNIFNSMLLSLYVDDCDDSVFTVKMMVMMCIMNRWWCFDDVSLSLYPNVVVAVSFCALMWCYWWHRR